MNTAIQEFEEIYQDNQNFTFEYDNNQIKFNSEISKIENLKIGIFLFIFLIVMLIVAGILNSISISWQFIIFVLTIGGLITAFCLRGRKNKVVIDFNSRTITNNNSSCNFSDCKNVHLTRIYIKIIPVGYSIELVTKTGKANFPFWYEHDKIIAERVFYWTRKYIQENIE